VESEKWLVRRGLLYRHDAAQESSEG
jgi:hypothetical protein